MLTKESPAKEPVFPLGQVILYKQMFHYSAKIPKFATDIFRY